MENQLSIIIPCYNVAEYLPVTLDSILSRQNFSSLEIILIDDGYAAAAKEENKD